ncbi:hypothetical protein J7E25_12885 [Agromyces sp. ISL-38]|uniref:aggregation-promoting factor C-terminal-like domain-containing protein n=1 Tax=Agromyces sp. ISL-38 TaxID=2819107 RepID=UPI001BEAB225|nr:hypothetical protein [Agromyces sp. ISL-38]MBT2499987.1 hypothetical protein [Agromyces sp. ISL-38]
MRTGIRVLAGLAVVLATTLSVPVAALAEDYPSWEEVESAKRDVAAREAEVTRITAFVDELEAESGRLGDAAVASAAAAATAEAAHTDASARAATLRAGADAAEAEAASTARQLGRVGAVLARSGGADVTLRLLFGTGDDRDLLIGLSRAAQLTNVYGSVVDRARAAEADAAALSAQAEVAERERARLALEAAATAESARAAHEAAAARVAEQQGALDTLYAQLASLRDRTVELERSFKVGQQAAAEEAARRAAAAAAAGGGSNTGGGAPPPGIVVDPAAAKAYAAGAIARYGWGDGEYRCLVLLWTRESGWRADAYNASSGAYGIPQSLPGSKMAAAGADWRTNAATQIEWGLSYIAARYGAPCGAWAHSEAYNWY